MFENGKSTSIYYIDGKYQMLNKHIHMRFAEVSLIWSSNKENGKRDRKINSFLSDFQWFQKWFFSLKYWIRNAFNISFISSVNITLFHFEEIQTIQNHKRTIKDFNCTIEYYILKGIFDSGYFTNKMSEN